MMFNRTIRVAFVFVVMGFVAQKVCGDVNDLAGESLKVYKQVEAIQAEMNAATSKERERIREIESMQKELSPEIVLEYTRQIKQYEEQIEDLKKRIVGLERKIKEVRNADPNERAAKAAKLDAEAKKLRTRERELAKPFDEQIEQLKRVAPEKKAAFNKAMEKYCLVPGKQYGEVTDTGATFGGSIISYWWKDANKGKRVAWAHLRLRDRPPIPTGARMLDDACYISNHSNNSIWVWAGHFHICFVMNRRDWQGKENVAEAVKQFIDLKGLAKICPTREVK
jgi:hypothetical protein